MEKKIFFFEKTNFHNYKKLKMDAGYEIKSITSYPTTNSISNISPRIIIDLSSIASSLNNPDSLQLYFEQLFPYFHSEIIFIADKKYKDILIYELRYCFDAFEDLQLDANENANENKVIESSKKIKSVIDLSEEEIGDFILNFKSSLYGHDNFKEEFEHLIRSFRIFNKLGEHKILSLFLMGDSGVGKTEVARAIHKCLNSKKALAKVNFGNYSSHDALNSLIGSPRGYIGSDGGELISRVANTDIGLILIDEFEKSNSSVFNYFLDVLENGKLINSLGDEIDIDGFIIIFTSNISQAHFNERISPELRSRFDYKAYFGRLLYEDKLKFIKYRLDEIIKKYERGFNNKLPIGTHALLVNNIDVNKFENMRDLNKKIKDEFVNYSLSYLNNKNMSIDGAIDTLKTRLDQIIANLK